MGIFRFYLTPEGGKGVKVEEEFRRDVTANFGNFIDKKIPSFARLGKP